MDFSRIDYDIFYLLPVILATNGFLAKGPCLASSLTASDASSELQFAIGSVTLIRFRKFDDK